MRIDGSTWTGNTDWRSPSPGNPLAGALVPMVAGESRRGFAPPFQHIPADEFILIHDESRGAVVIDLYLAAQRFDESPTYRLTGKGDVEVGKKPRKGGIVNLLA
jgi:hypothetical protein